jgi:hypothetical protein
MTSTKKQKIDDEWSRVSQNPDNMIVSDVIKESIDKLLSVKDTAVSSVPPVVSLSGEGIELSMEMSRIDMAPNGWSVSCIAGMSDGYSLIGTDRKKWKRIAVCAEPGAAPLWQADIRADVIRVEVEFPAATGLSIVNLSCSNEREQTRVL